MGLTVRELYPNSPCGAFGSIAPSAADAACANPPCGHQQRPAAVPWYALSVKHQHERTVETALVEQGFEAFSPTYSSRRQWSDRAKEIALPLFAGYAFCRFPNEAKTQVLRTPAIWRVVEFGGRPAAVADAEIEALRSIVASGLPVRPWPHLKPGDRVRIERGPLRGVEGVLIREKDALEFIVGVEMLQRSVAVRIEGAAVAPVASCGAPRSSRH
ncbi:MAG TPA: UpxY family transcription antiterminator [Bryobacteraceae bacterium]|nr:UpxY family transcription antiterminator [Bryobacteraceae bacterium]